MTRPVPRDELNLSLAVTSLMKGVVYRDSAETAWRHVLGLASQISDYVATMGLAVVIDEAEGYAFLRSKGDDELADLGIPRLVARHQLPLHTSLLLAVLRKKLAEHDTTDAGNRLVLTSEQLRELILPFFPVSANEARAADQADTAVRRVTDLGFLRRMPGQAGEYEVRRVVKAYVDAQWLADLDTHLTEYAEAMTQEQR